MDSSRVESCQTRAHQLYRVFATPLLGGHSYPEKNISVIHRLIYTNISVWNSILACHGPVDGSVWEFDILSGCLVLTVFKQQRVQVMEMICKMPRGKHIIT